LIIKIIGFKVGVARPTFNRTLDLSRIPEQLTYEDLGHAIMSALEKSDFLSIRRLNE
jgi:hypothetical protein